MKLPKHACGLYISHNQHKDSYEPADEFLALTPERDIWESQEDRLQAIKANEIWELQWYPITPISFYVIRASTLEGLLAFASKIEQDNT